MANDEVVSVPLQTPQISLTMDADTAHYVGILEGTVAALVINECKYRAILELLTGESWEATRLDIKGDVLQQLAVSALVRQTGMALDRAKLLVAQRWNAKNQEAPVVVPQAVAVQPSDASVASATVPSTQGTGSAVSDSPSGQDMGSRLSAWKARQQAAAEALDAPTA